ncbi:MAG: alpha/beta hydrolase [Bacteroidetes bacterium]|nr:alpha/beta hydrolase [Bacteroidota bacterium]
MNEAFLNYYNKIIHYTTEGQGNTIVLLHGFMESLQIWEDFSYELAKKHRVVCIDLPGHGKSECIQQVHTMELMADVIKRVVDELEITSFLLIGHSMGGYVSLQFADKYPDMLKGLVLFHSQAMADTEEGKIMRDRTCDIVKQNRKNFIIHFIPDLFAEENIEKFAKEISLLQSFVIDMKEEAIIAAIQGMKGREARFNVLKDLSVPVLFILGKMDKRISLQNAMEQAQLPVHAEVLLLEIGHMGYIEARNETLHTIKAFAEKCFELKF